LPVVSIDTNAFSEMPILSASSPLIIIGESFAEAGKLKPTVSVAAVKPEYLTKLRRDKFLLTIVIIVSFEG